MSEFFQKLFSKLTVLAGVALVVSFVFDSCKKPEENPQAEITVVDSTGTAVSEAKVVLFCVQRPDVTTECNVADTQYTDGVGKANFEFENPSVLRVAVIKYNTEERQTGTGSLDDVGNEETVIVGDTLCADGFVTLEVNEVTEEVFVLGKCEID